MNKRSFFVLGVSIICISAAWPAEAAVILFDDFNNNDLATGGAGSVNGGFQLVTNGVGSSPTVTEPVGTTANTTTGSGFNNSGIVSIGTFDPTATSEFSVTWDVDSQTGVGTGNFNTTEMLVQSSTSFRNNASAQPWIEFRITPTGSWQILAHDGTSQSTLHNGGGLVGGVPNGYEVTMTFNDAGYSIVATGFSANPSFGEPWDANFNYSDFGSSMHVAAMIQNANNSVDFLNVDSILVDVVVPEPNTAGLTALGLLSLGLVGWRRRRRA